ncbi:MAG TPA: hypothetical protein VK828_11510 [Terriglobales bacterium]|jgi:hypothetical protein|nr:hypothetical protein [Terriglobales bacterium]
METVNQTLVAPTPAHSALAAPAHNKMLQGSVLVLIQFDVCEEINLDSLRKIFGARRQEASFKHPAPGYVRFQRPPVVEQVEPLILESGERLDVQIKYYDYGVLSVVFELPFSGDWDTLVGLAGRWVWDTDFTSFAQKIVKQKIERARPALIKLYDSWLHEDYFVFHVRDIAGNPSAAELLAAQGGRIAQIVRGESMPLSEGEQAEIMQSKISYYPNDLAVISWNGAFLYDSTAGAETVIQLLEYANSQLLEFRHYDELLTRELASVYDFMDHGSGIWARWRTARRASRLHTVLLDVDELTERADNAIKFLSDMFSARLYKVAASKIGVTDYKDLVNQKVHTAEELYRFMIDQFHQSRAFVLELMVVIILIIDLIWLFKGRTPI